MHVTLFELHADDVQFGPKNIGGMGRDEMEEMEEMDESDGRTMRGPPRGLLVVLALVAGAVMLRRRRMKGDDTEGAEVEIVA